MDTLTQITLGAACGEAVLGKKLGNRAMAWGAVGGLLPDLDVAANLFTDEIHALAFHRGIMHSVVFAAAAAIGLSWLTEWLYRKGHFKRPWYKITVISMVGLLLLVIFGALNYVAFSPKSGLNLEVLGLSVAAAVWLGWLTWKRYYRSDRETATVTRREWAWMFWWAIFTHPVLDCFTAYGTQLFQPFSNYPVAFSNISVLDPLYTVPFLICLLIAASLRKDDRRRRLFNWLGIGLSSAYMLFTLYHKYRADEIFQAALAEKNIPAARFMTSPTILNNFLWQGVAETDSNLYHASFSFFDKAPYIREFNVLKKNHALAAPYDDTYEMRTFKWFTRGYYTVLPVSDSTFQVNDLRYGSIEENFTDDEKYVFRFIVENNNGDLEVYQKRAYHRISWAGLKELFARINGRDD